MITNEQLQRMLDEAAEERRRLAVEQHVRSVKYANQMRIAKRPGKGHRQDWRKEL